MININSTVVQFGDTATVFSRIRNRNKVRTIIEACTVISHNKNDWGNSVSMVNILVFNVEVDFIVENVLYLETYRK